MTDWRPGGLPVYSPPAAASSGFPLFVCLRATRVPRLLAVALLLLGAGGCSPRGGLTWAPEAAAVGTVETILVATDRVPVEGQPVFTRARVSPPSFLRFEVSVPPDREPGTVTFPARYPPDPRTDFLTVEARRLAGEPGFIEAVNAEIAANPQISREALLFVHGFNTTFAEGLYRQAQIQRDTDRRSVQVHFAWPSAAATQGYVYDRESVLYSRDGLETAIAALARSQATDITLVAHSMGGLLLMDTLRTMARVGFDDVFARTRAVVLLAPDIEIDVFIRQAQPVLARGVPIIIVVSKRDRALLASALIRGERERLGSIDSTDDLGGLDVTIIDVSDVNSTGLGHFAIATSPALLGLLRSLGDGGLQGLEHQTGPLEAGVAIVQEGASVVLSPLTR